MKISNSKKKHKFSKFRPMAGPEAMRYMEIPKKENRCPFKPELFCKVCDMGECDVYRNGMKSGQREVKKKSFRNSMKGCSHVNMIYPKIDVCSGCGEILTDLEYMGYFLPDKYIDKLIEYNKKRGNLSELAYRKKVNSEGTVKKRVENGN